MRSIKKLLTCTLSMLMLFNVTSFYVSAESGEEILLNELVGKTKFNSSIYGYDLEDNMIVESPDVGSFTINDDIVNVSGFVDTTDSNTSFNLVGTAFKTYDNNIVCNVVDTTNKYDVIFLCLEKKQEHNDYILYRNSSEDIEEYMGDYGLKIYLMRKGTRDISILEDLDVQIPDLSSTLVDLEETEYSNLNWFTYCFEPIPEESASVMPTNVTTTRYTYWDSDTYFFGSVTASLGIKLTATNDTPNVSNTTNFTSKLEHEYLVNASDSSYNNPLRAAGYFRVEDIGIEATVGQGYYLQQVRWNASGASTISSSKSLNLSIGYGLAGYTVSATTRSFKKENWLNLVNSECVYYSNMPRHANTEYDDLIISTPSHYADFSAIVVNIPEYTDKFKCYQTKWTFDITKKNFWAGYSTVKSNQYLYCTSYFS